MRTSKHLSARVALAALVAILCGGFLPAIGSAQEGADDETARTLFQAGKVYYERARYEKAAESFAEAYRLSQRPVLLLNLARALEAAGRLDEAIDALERYLETAEDEDLRASAEKVLARLLAGREQRDAQREAEAQAAEAAEAAEAAGAGEGAEDGDPEALPGSFAPAQDPGMSLSTSLGIGALGLGGAAAIVAIATGVAHRSTYRDLEAACPGGVCDASLREDAERGLRLSRTSTAFTFIGVAAAAGGIVGLVLGAKKKDSGDAEAKKVELTSGPGLVGAGLGLRF